MSPFRDPIRPPELSELETLVVCAAEGSLVGASAKLGITRTAVAKRIRNLEALAARPLLDRGGRGVRLTPAGATVLAAARSMLEERDVLMSKLAELRGDGGSAIAGLREMLGGTTAVTRATQTPEARLAETERVLELVLRASATGVAISDPETSVLYEVNDAFCEIVGRSREELVGHAGLDVGVWYDPAEREGLIRELHRSGELAKVRIRVRRPDGSMRVTRTTARFVALGGRRRLVSTVDDITERTDAAREHDRELSRHRARADIAGSLLAGNSAVDSVTAGLADLRSSGGCATAAVWDLDANRVCAFEGATPPDGLGSMLLAALEAPHDGVIPLGLLAGGEHDAHWGLAVMVPPGPHALMLLAQSHHATSATTERLLREVAALLRARA